MSLLSDIQEAAISSDRPLGDLLRRCRVLATRLGSAEFGAWVDQELNGYKERSELPDYRIVQVNSFGFLAGRVGSRANNIPIPLALLPEEFRERFSNVYLMDPVVSYEDSLKAPENHLFQCPWPADLVAIMGPRVMPGMNLIGAYQQIPRVSIVSLVETVRNRVLNFALEIEKIAPAMNDPHSRAPALPEDRIHQIVQNYIYGNVGNYAVSSANFEQHSGMAPGDIAGLRSALLGLGFEEREVSGLVAAAQEDQQSGSGVGAKVNSWLGGALKKAGDGALKVSVQTASTVLPKIISSYLGLPPE